jgi:hypothetical protein
MLPPLLHFDKDINESPQSILPPRRSRKYSCDLSDPHLKNVTGKEGGIDPLPARYDTSETKA